MADSKHSLFSFAPAQPATLARWGARLLVHEDTRDWIYRDPHRFAATFAMLHGRLPWPANIRHLLDRVNANGRLSGDKKHSGRDGLDEDSLPFNGRLSASYSKTFLLGVALWRSLQKQPGAWEKAVDRLRLANVEAGLGEGTLLNINGRVLDLASALDGSLDDRSTDGGVLDEDLVKALGTESRTAFDLNLLLLGQLIRMSDTDKAIIELSFLLRQEDSVRLLFDLLDTNEQHVPALVRIMLDVDDSTYEAAVGNDGLLSKSGLVRFEAGTRKILAMSRFWHSWFLMLPVTARALFQKIVRPLREKTNAGAMGRLGPDDADIVRRVLRRQMQRETGINVLLYGPGSLDKTGVALHLLRELGLHGYTLADDVKDEDCAAACYVAQRWLAVTDPEAVLVLPRADAVLRRSYRGSHKLAWFTIELDEDEQDTPIEGELLSGNPVKSIWIVNRTERLSEDNVGRFLYASEVRPVSRADRRRTIDGALQKLDLPESARMELAQHVRLSEQQLASAARLAAWIGDDCLNDGVENGNGVEQSGMERVLAARLAAEKRQERVRSIVVRSVEQSQRALNRRQREELRTPITTYNLDLLNVAGSFKVTEIIQALRRQPIASLCFWGIPGTGKTQLAEQLAIELDKPILIKRASDLLDKFVGETEHKIRAMFEEAADEDALLLLDEADSFLRDRSYARNSWEVTCVNELLQDMERFNGTFICATNLFQQLDAAAMRRFTFKLEFLPLTERQRWAMFVNEVPLTFAEQSGEQAIAWRRELDEMRLLTPGDYAVVKRQARMLGKAMNADNWIQALRAEMSTKKQIIERSMQPD